MKSNVKLAMAAWLQALMILIVPCQVEGKPSCEVAVAALNLPDDADGLLHVRAAVTATSPLQLSTRYFSERVKLPGRVIQFYKDPVATGPAPPLSEPLLTVRIPAETQLAYIVLWSEWDENRQPRWRATSFSAKDWEGSSMKVLNACSEDLGISAGKKRISLPRGKSVDFRAQDWKQPFPVKIFLAKSMTRSVFSSKWRVSAGRRELCFISQLNGAVTLRSLFELAVVPRDS